MAPTTSHAAGIPRGLMWALGVGLFLRLAYWVGVAGFDDSTYCFHARSVVEGTFSNVCALGDDQCPFSLRSGIIFPTAAVFALFGQDEYTGAALPLLFSMGTIVMAWLLGRRIDPRTGLLGAFLMATLPLSVVNASTLAVETFSTFLTGASAYAWLRGDDEVDAGRARRGLIWFFAGGFSLGLAYLFRLESGLLSLFFIAYCVWRRRIRVGYVVAGLGCFLVLFAESAAYWYQHGVWFYHLWAISESFAAINGHLVASIEAMKSPIYYLRTIYLRPIELGAHWVAVLPAAVYFLWRRSPQTQVMLLWFWPVVLYLNFGSWSLSEYVPTTKESRYLLLVTLPGILLVARLMGIVMDRWQWPGRAFVAGTFFMSFLALQVAHVYHRENTAGLRLAAAWVREQPPLQVYTEHAEFDSLACFLPERTVARVNHVTLSYGQRRDERPAAELSGSYVVVDRFVLAKYGAYAQLPVPSYLEAPPPEWERVFSAPHPTDGPAYFAMRSLRALLAAVGGPTGGLSASLSDAPVEVYRVP